MRNKFVVYLVSLFVLVGVGAATALGGALTGTLLPQAESAMGAFNTSSMFGLLEGGVMLTGTALTLDRVLDEIISQENSNCTIKNISSDEYMEFKSVMRRNFLVVLIERFFKNGHDSGDMAEVEKLEGFLTHPGQHRCHLNCSG